MVTEAICNVSITGRSICSCAVNTKGALKASVSALAEHSVEHPVISGTSNQSEKSLLSWRHQVLGESNYLCAKAEYARERLSGCCIAIKKIGGVHPDNRLVNDTSKQTGRNLILQCTMREATN